MRTYELKSTGRIDSPRWVSSKLMQGLRLTRPFRESTTRVAGSFRTCLSTRVHAQLVYGLPLVGNAQFDHPKRCTYVREPYRINAIWTTVK